MADDVSAAYAAFVSGLKLGEKIRFNKHELREAVGALMRGVPVRSKAADLFSRKQMTALVAAVKNIREPVAQPVPEPELDIVGRFAELEARIEKLEAKNL